MYSAIVVVSTVMIYFFYYCVEELNRIKINDYYKGKIHYLIVKDGNSSLGVINYTQDSTMAEENSKYLGK